MDSINNPFGYTSAARPTWETARPQPPPRRRANSLQPVSTVASSNIRPTRRSLFNTTVVCVCTFFSLRCCCLSGFFFHCVFSFFFPIPIVHKLGPKKSEDETQRKLQTVKRKNNNSNSKENKSKIGTGLFSQILQWNFQTFGAFP